MQSRYFGKWRLDSWGKDFSPMLFGPHESCIEILDGHFCWSGLQEHGDVPIEALLALRNEHAEYSNQQPRLILL